MRFLLILASILLTSSHNLAWAQRAIARPVAHPAAPVKPAVPQAPK